MSESAPPPHKVIRFANKCPGETVPRTTLARPEAIDRSWAWADARGAGVRVCIIDSGVDSGELEAGECDRRAVQYRDGEPCVVEDTAGDAAGHGTSCAVIIRRMAPLASLTSVRVLGADLGGSSQTLLAALRWAIDQRFDVVNLSLSTGRLTYKEQLHDVVDRAFFENVAIVASANNAAVDSYPWMFPAVFSVGSHLRADPEWLELNPAPPAEFFGFGVRVPVPKAGRRVLVSGNSYATPHVAGMVARVLAHHPGLSVAETRHVLRALSCNVS